MLTCALDMKVVPASEALWGVKWTDPSFTKMTRSTVHPREAGGGKQANTGPSEWSCPRGHTPCSPRHRAASGCRNDNTDHENLRMNTHTGNTRAPPSAVGDGLPCALLVFPVKMGGWWRLRPLTPSTAHRNLGHLPEYTDVYLCTTVCTQGN